MKKIIYILAAIVLAVILAGIYRFNFTNDDIYAKDDLGNVVKYDDYKKEIWKGNGFEPGFYFSIMSANEQSEYFTKVSFQEGGDVEGYLKNTADTDGLKTFEGNLLLGGDGNVPTKIEITKGECAKPSGDIVSYKVKLTFATDVYNGCAESI